MKNFSILLISICVFTKSYSQKPVIDSIAIVNWQHIRTGCSISNDGSYFLFSSYDNQHHYTLIAQNTNNNWKKEFPGVTSGSFSSDSKKMIFKRNDTLFISHMGTEQIDYVPNILSYITPNSESGTWLAYQLKSNKKECVLLNILTGNKKQFDSVDSYQFDDQGTVLLLKTSSIANGKSNVAIKWVDIKTGKITTPWTKLSSDDEENLSNLKFDRSGTQLAFAIKKKTDEIKGQTSNSIWYYNTKMDKAVLVVNNQTLGIKEGLTISDTDPFFSADGRYILFNLWQISSNNILPSSNAVMVDIWSYKDSVLQSTQLATNPQFKKEHLCAISPQGERITQLEREDEQLRVSYNQIKGDFVLFTTKKSIGEYWQQAFKQKAVYVVSLKNGSREFIGPDSLLTDYMFSPNGKYLLYFDSDQKSYFTYTLLVGKKMNISAKVSESLSNKSLFDSLRTPHDINVGIAGWLKNDDALFIYDNYDIWEIDPAGKRSPVNITNGYGKRHNIKLRFLNESSSTVYSRKDKVFLVAFNDLNKDNGFFSITLNKKKDPQILTMGPYYSYINPSQAAGFLNVIPQKAKSVNKWVILRQTASDAPNFFLTTDFKNFKQLTNIQPQKKYNWLTSELLTWNQLDSTITQGILYKPENFDPNKKYPIIFMYYRTMSEFLHEFESADFTYGSINIPWFVSRGYLVVKPDIHYYIGKIGESVCNSVISAALYLSRFPWVDTTKMAINGHSFGGYETNYLVTHSSIFAAAASAAGVSDIVSHYGDVSNMNNTSTALRFERAEYYIGANLWERPDLYLKNTPVLNADKVTTPLLIMHNKADDAVPWSQSVEFFTGLRRLGKKAWMLQYDQGGHGVGGKEAADYTTRLTQFFDYYLKDSLPPKWMTEGISAKYKGIKTGYELDTTGKQP